MGYRVWTPEERLAASARAKERWALGQVRPRKPKAKVAPDPVSEPQLQMEPNAPNEPLQNSAPIGMSEPSTVRAPQVPSDPLRDLAALVVQAVSQDAEQDKILEQFTNLISKIDFKKHPELRDHPAMQNLMQQAFDLEREAPRPTERLAPGTVLGNQINSPIVPWTWEHVKFLHDVDPQGMYKMKTVMCTKTEQIIINGLGCWFPEGQEITFYAPWVDNYVQSIRAPREAQRHMQWLFKQGPWGPNVPVEMQPAPDLDWLQDDGLRMRAEGEGMYRPGMGWNPAVDGKRWIPGGGPAPEVPAAPEPAPAPAE